MRSFRSPCPLSPVSELKFVKFHHSMTMDKFCRANSDFWRGQCMRLQRCPPRPGRSKNLETPYFALHPPHPPPNVNSPTRPPIRPAHKLTQPLWLRTSYEGLTHYMRSLVMTKWSLPVTKCVQKCPKNRTMNKKGSNFEEKMGFKFQTKAQKWRKSILSCRFGDPYGKAGDQCRIRESWKGSFRALARVQIPLSPSSFKALFTMRDGKLP